jgi:hypothetical protein
MRPVHFSGLIDPGDRESIGSMAERFAQATATASTISFPIILEIQRSRC